MVAVVAVVVVVVVAVAVAVAFLFIVAIAFLKLFVTLSGPPCHYRFRKVLSRALEVIFRRFL